MDNAKKIELTAEGRQKLVDELAYREGEKHDEIVERIKEARGFGDLSENSEYDAAKEEQSKNESRINEIRQILSVARVVEGGSAHDLAVSIGTPVGRALIGHREGDVVEVVSPSGRSRKYTIVSIER